MSFSPVWIIKILRYIRIFNLISLPILGILFIVCILEGIPLTSIFGYIIIFGVTKSISLIFDTEKHINKNTKQEYEYVFLAIANILIYVILYVLIDQYQLNEYRWTIFILSLWIINIIFLEFHKKYLSKLFVTLLRSSVGKWMIHTLLLIFVSGITFATWNSLTSTTITNKWKPKSETTGVLSTIDHSATGQELITQVETVSPWSSLKRYLGIGNSWEDVLSIQRYLFKEWYYTGKLSGNYDQETAVAINRYIWETTGEEFSRSEFWAMKLAFLNKLSTESKNNETIINKTWLESSWITVIWWSGWAISNSTESSGWVKINTIQSMNSWATASIEDGKIVVQVIAPEKNDNSSNIWEVRSVLKNIKWAGWLQWVVISTPKANPRAWTYDTYQSIVFSADWASWIFLTTDGSDPTCEWKWLTKFIRKTDSISIKAISCFGWNRIRWPISIHNFSIKN